MIKLLSEMTKWHILLILLICSSVYCEDCVTFDFEKDFNSSFSNKIGVCDERPMWNIGRYEDIPMKSPDPASFKFIYPINELSCSSSFTFEMTGGGVLEVNMYMEPSSPMDQVTILANQEVPGGQDTVVGMSLIIASAPNFVRGWRAVRINLTGIGTYRGYVTLLGIAQIQSIVLVDSFRYISPSIKEEECVIYEKNATTTTSTIPTNDFSTEKETTEPSAPITTITTFTADIKPTTKYTTSEQTTESILTTELKDTDSTIKETQTEPFTITKTESPETTATFFSTYSTSFPIQPSTIDPTSLTTETTTSRFDITSTVNDLTTTTLTSSVKTTKTDYISTEKVITDMSSTTINDNVTPEIKSTTDYVSTGQSQGTQPVSTTKSKNTGSTTRETQTEPYMTTQTGDPSFPMQSTTIESITFTPEITQSTTIQPDITSVVDELITTTLFSQDTTSQTYEITTEKGSTGSSTPYTTVPIITPDIKTTTDFTTSDQPQVPTSSLTTQFGDYDSTTRETQTERSTLDPKTTETYILTDPTFPIQSSTIKLITLTTEAITSESTPSDISIVYESTITTLSSDKTTTEITEDPSQSTIIYLTTSTVTVKDITTKANSEYESTSSGSVSTIANNPTKYTEENTEIATGMTSQTTTISTISSTDMTTTYSATTTDVTQITLHPETTTFGESESISTAEDIESGTTEQPYTYTTEEFSNESPENTTQNPPHRPRYSFWNAFTKTMVIILFLMIVVITAIIWYYIGKRSSPRESQFILPYFEEAPITLTIPRATKVWTDSNTINRLTSIIKME